MAKIFQRFRAVKNNKRIIENDVASAGCVVWIKDFQDFLIDMPQFVFKFFHGSSPDKRIIRLDDISAKINTACCRLKNLLFRMKFEFEIGFNKSFNRPA
jgi:hypothetical protein